MKQSLNVLFFAVLSILWLSSSAAIGAVLTTDTVWSGTVNISEDILVPQGVTLTIQPGTVVTMSPAESTKTDPEYLSPLTEITIRGTLNAKGTELKPITFTLAREKKTDLWAGILIDGGTVTMQHCLIRHAETGLLALAGVAVTEDSILTENRYGVIIQGKKAAISLRRTTISSNDYGLCNFSGATVDSKDLSVKGNRKKDRLSGLQHQVVAEPKDDDRPGQVVSRQYGDEVLLGETVWQGRIEINGTIRLPEKSRLVIMPGTTVEFKKKDTNGDGIGENGLLIQGVLIAKGTPTTPILFRSAEKHRQMGDWDSINIMNSDGVQNLVEYCRIEDAYRGLHFHFSNVLVNKSLLKNNYRGIQFQESTVDLRGNVLRANKSGVQGRDSELAFTGNTVCDNYHGVNFYRTAMVAKDNAFTNNSLDGVRIREGITTFTANLVDGNRYGLMLADSFFGDFSGNVISNNDEIGMSLKNLDNIGISGNYLSGNGLNGMSVQDVRATIRANQFSDNGERGLGIVSFDGVITENSFVSNGLYAIDLDGGMDVSAPNNWWGGSTVESVIFDKLDDPQKGRVRYEKARQAPVPFAWPLPKIITDVTWRGDIIVTDKVAVLPGAALTIAPGTVVQFAAGAGLNIKGKLLAKGEKDALITFTSAGKKESSAWDEIILEFATGSKISYSVIEYATWGIHSHFTNLSITNCRFHSNFGGMRFRSGPVEVRHSTFTGNSIGIRSYKGNALIANNSISDNEIGIFVREKGGGLEITGNNLVANQSYNIRLGDFNDEDVKARGNWWGHGDPAETIFDSHREAGIGMVLYEPYLQQPVIIESTGSK